MPTITPFRALCYAPSLRRDLDRLVAPPYDVISEERRDRLASRHRNNIVHLDLPRAGPRGDPYDGASRLLEAWIRDHVLARESVPAYFACEQRYRAPSGEERIRRGLFARVQLEPLDGGVVIPHERTLDRPRADRQRLLAVTRTHLSAVFMLHPDPGAEVSRVLAEVCAAETCAQASDDDGTLSRLVRVDDASRIGSLTQRLAGQWALIADGHHRYESALAYRDERRAAGARDAEHVLAFLCSLEDPGLAIFPIHRLVHSLQAFDAERFRTRLRELFDLTRIDGEDALRAALGARLDRAGVFGIALRGETGFWLAEWKEGAGLGRPEMAPIPEPLRNLDVILLHRLVLEGILGITPEAQARQANLDYVKDARDWHAGVRSGRADLGVLMNPTRIEQVIEVTRKELRLPQKSTYFYPKVLSGLVLDPLDP
ncbi:MAG TPA: DUF1015 domain-containing protein [Candidatus Polarisedimenticolia bacterium]|nr:DUF1015 domain-containing protein [Candidatus Polarisedimenticolia bacterium]